MNDANTPPHDASIEPRPQDPRTAAALLDSVQTEDVARWVLDIEHGHFFGDRNLSRMAGLALEPSAHASLAQYLTVVHPEDRARVRHALEQAVSDGADETLYLQEYRIGKEARWVSARGRVVRDPLTASTRLLGLLLDLGVRRGAVHPCCIHGASELSVSDGGARDVIETAEPRRSPRRVRVDDELLRGIFAQATAGIALIDLTGRFVEVNDRFCEILGRTAEELSRCRMHDVTHPDDLAQTIEYFERLLEDGDAFHFEKRYVRPDETFAWVNLSVSLVRNAAGIPSSVVAVAVDISKRKQAEDAQHQLAGERERLLQSERAARGEAERTSRMKDEFLATLSHELRTPLSAILAWSEVVRRGAHDPRQVERGLDVIERNARAQTQIVEDLLEMSSIIRGKVRMERAPLDLTAVVRAAVETARPAADAKEVAMSLQVEPDEALVRGDAGRLQQVLWNLLSNAVKFTPRGGRVDVSLAQVDDHFELSVQDSGEGIEHDFLPYVFDRFRQADPSTTRRHGGLGLGLSIVKELVELHGGSVTAHSDGLDQGARFVVSLPPGTSRSSPPAGCAT